MVQFGVGKNMVRSIRFWSLATGVASAKEHGGKCLITSLGNFLFGKNGGDPFLEDIRTLWLLHWKISTNMDHPLLAWDYLLNHWQEPEIAPNRVLKRLQQEIEKEDERMSLVTLEQHFATFLHTYVPTRGRKGEILEDNLDCPLVELEFITKVGERQLDRATHRSEPIYAFRREEKPEITPALFIYCLNDFWDARHSNEATLDFQAVAHGHGSPGQIFKLTEDDVLTRLENLAVQTKEVFSYKESANQQQIFRNRIVENIELLKKVYVVEAIRA